MSPPVECLHAGANVLGEGPLWDDRRRTLFWFDIKQAQLHGWNEPAARHSQVDLPFRASAACLTGDGRLLTATERGLHLLDPDTGALTPHEPLDLGPGFRSNDGKIDPHGRFWWSSMDDDEGRRPGAIFRTEAGAPTKKVADGVHIANSMAFTADGGRWFLADSTLSEIRIFDLAADGTPGPGRLFASTSGEGGAPDGSAMDAEGGLWNAEWGAGRVVRHAPDGTIDRVVPMPVSQPSCCAFGGEDLMTLYVTSAREGLSPEALAGQKLAGGLFAFRPGVAGQALPRLGEGLA